MAKIKKPTKKAQNGVAVSQDNRGVYTYTKRVNTKDGPRYYQGRSLNRSMAENIADFKNRATPADSTRKADISALKLKTMDEVKKKGGVIKKMQAGGKIEEQYQKQKKVTSKQAEMDKIKTSYPKTTLKKAQNGAATRDSTKFYQDKLKGLSTTSPRWSAAANIINSNKKDENFAERQKTKYDLLRQYRKGKSGFDANGNPLKKNKTGGVIKKTTKPVVKKIVKSIKKKK
jgi:hypothetical protein